MTTKKNGEGAAAAATPQKDNVKAMNAVIEQVEKQKKYFEDLTDKINQRGRVLTHLTKLKRAREGANFDDLFNDEENLDRDSIGKIALHFDDNRHSSYDIVNSNLLREVSNFIEGKLSERVEQLEKEIASIQV